MNTSSKAPQPDVADLHRARGTHTPPKQPTPTGGPTGPERQSR